MATTSTGYHRNMIIMNQPTSSGQIMTVSSGCQFDLEADSHFDAKSGSTMNLRGSVNLKSGFKMTQDAGSTIVSSSGSYQRGTVTSHTSASTTIGYHGGHKKISSTIANTFKIKRPTKAGRRFTIHVVGTSFAQTFRASTAKSARFGSSALKGYSMVVTPTSKSKTQGINIELVSLSTNSWSPIIGYTTNNAVTFTTAT